MRFKRGDLVLVWTIENYRLEKRCYTAERVYDTLIDYFDTTEEEAIDAESWSELACIGESYYGENFKITIDEE